MLALDATLEPAPSVLFTAVGPDAVLYRETDECYFGLNPVAARVWVLAASGRSLGAIRQVLLDEFAVSAEVLDADLADLVQRMAQAGLWTIVQPTP